MQFWELSKSLVPINHELYSRSCDFLYELNSTRSNYRSNPALFSTILPDMSPQSNRKPGLGQRSTYMVTWYWSADTLFWQVSIDHNIDVVICRLWLYVPFVSMENYRYSYGVQFGINCTALDQSKLSNFVECTISNGNRTEWSPIQTVITRMITKSDHRAAGVRFVNHEYDYRLNWMTLSPVTN